MQNIKQSFIFYASFYDAIEDLSDKKRLKIYDAIARLALKNEEIELYEEEKRLFCLIKPQILANLKRYEDGQKGGRPKKEIFEEIKTSGFENKKPNENKNVNINENVNVYVNDPGEDQERKQKINPYINPIRKFVVDEYTRIFATKPFLSNQDCLRIVELSAEHEDIKELMTIALTKLKTIKFDDINFKPSINWLLKNNNFERVLNGEFEKEEDKQKKKKQELRERMKREGKL